LLDFLHDGLSPDSNVSHKSLNLRGFVESLAAFFLKLSADNVSSDIVSLLEDEGLSDLGSSLGAKSLWLVLVSESWNVGRSFFEDGKLDDAKIWAGDAASA